MDPNELRSLVIECLRRTGCVTQAGMDPYQLRDLFHAIAEVAKQRGLKTVGGHDVATNDCPPQLYANLSTPVSDICHDLIVEGVIRPGALYRPDLLDLPFIHLTEHGQRFIQDVNTPYDPEGFVRRLKEAVPNIDTVIETYVAESAKTLRGNCLLSSTTALGCASEQAFLLLLEATRDALTPTHKTTFDNAMRGKFVIKAKYEEYKVQFATLVETHAKARFTRDWVEQKLEASLNLLFQYFRMNRNSTGHPSGAAFDRETCYANLMMFPGYVKVICGLTDWLKTNVGQL